MVVLSPDLESCVLDVEQGCTTTSIPKLRRRTSSNNPLRTTSVDSAGSLQHQKQQQHPTPEDSTPSASLPLSSPQDFWSYCQQELKTFKNEDDDLLLKVDINLTQSVDKLAGYVKICDSVTTNISKARDLLDDLEAKHQTVSEKSSSLHETCKKLLEEQVRFEKIVKDIETPINILREVDRIGPLLGLPLETRLKSVAAPLTTPGITQIRQLNPDSPHFFDLIIRLEECIEYIEGHPEFKDYEEYSTKFHQLHLRGLCLIRNLIVDSLRATSTSAKAGVETKLEQFLKNDQQQQTRAAAFDSELNSLMFIRFHAQAKQLRPYIEELEKRIGHKDGSDLLFTCQRSYCNFRLELLKLTVPRRPEVAQRPDLLSTLRIACPYLLSVSKMEWKLFHEYFTEESVDQLRFGADEYDSGERALKRSNSRNSLAESTLSTTIMPMVSKEAFGDMMTDLCGLLYDLLRPLIVKLKDLDLLCETVRVIEGEIIEGYIEGVGEAGLPLQDIVIEILRDVQERLIFSASEYINANIMNYQPQPGDLDYPKILVEAAGAAKDQRRPAMYSGCYKTLEKTLMCLGQIYRCVEPRTFEELAQDAVVSCASSLSVAAELISNTSKIDGDLFFIKHLLVLREQISPFNTQLTVKQIKLDFSTTANAFNDFVMHSRNIFSRHNNAIVDLVQHGVPTIMESELDCKRDLESQLKQACEQFIVRAYEQALASLIAFLQRASKPIADENQAFHEQDFAQPEKVKAMLTQCVTSVDEFLEMISSKMSLYLANSQTESILFKPIRANIFSALSQLTNCIEANYGPDDVPDLLNQVSALRTKVLDRKGTKSTCEVKEPAPAADSSKTNET